MFEIFDVTIFVTLNIPPFSCNFNSYIKNILKIFKIAGGRFETASLCQAAAGGRFDLGIPA